MQTPIPYDCRIEAVRGLVTIICNESRSELMTMTPAETMELVAELRGIEPMTEEVNETCARLELAAKEAERQVGAVRGAFHEYERFCNHERDTREMRSL